ncbi:MAG TPA: lipase family protein, partial [Dongiaceae bacterium]|nr:lipase family protein [Dongiaceae bacterium]
PFPVYPRLVETLAAAHLSAPVQRDPTVAHVLATCAGYAYADSETVARMMTRLGLERHGCVRVTQTVDAMLIFSTAYLVQSQCGRVVILCYRGTEPATLGNWLGDADIGPERTRLRLEDGEATIGIHAGFHRNVRATWWQVLEELAVALRGGSLTDHQAHVAHPLEALYVTGHSLGGAMALLFALRVSCDSAHRAIADRLRAVYTFGQPMALAPPLPTGIEGVGRKVFRHVLARDPVPVLPPARWGPFVHVGHEYRYADGDWRPAESPVAQLDSLRELSRSLLAFFASARRRGSSRYAFAEHAPHHYIAALRPHDRVTEFGDGAPP